MDFIDDIYEKAKAINPNIITITVSRKLDAVDSEYRDRLYAHTKDECFAGWGVEELLADIQANGANGAQKG